MFKTSELNIFKFENKIYGKKIILLLIAFFICLSLNAQDKPVKWSERPMWMFDFSNKNRTPFQPIPEQTVKQPSAPVYYNSKFGISAVNPSFRVLPRTNSYQSEVILVRNPLNPNIMFGSSNAINAVAGLFISEGVYVTTNGGATWYGSDTLNGTPINNHGGDPGPTIDKNGRFIISHLGYTTSGMFANYSTDNGLTWSSNYTIQAGSVDKNFCGTMDVPASPYYGRSYTVWTTFSGTYPAMISYTDNGGATWSAPSQIIPPASGRISRAEDLRCGPNGEVYVTWTPNVGSNPEDQCAFAKSTDGGVTFTGTQNAFAMSGLLIFNGGFGSYNIRMNSFPRLDVDRSGGPRNGWIYIVVSQKNLAPAGTDPDIVLHRSTDGGATWSAGIRVNQDPINNGKYQFYNAIRVDEYGGVNVVYYDNRNTSADSAECFVSRSIDGGNTWTDIQVSGHRFKPKPITIGGIAGGYAGDYIGITSGNNKVWPFWMDDISGTYQAWTAAVDLGPSIIHTPLANTEQTAGTRPVNCVINPAGSGINPSLTKLNYAKNSTSWTAVNMTNTSGTNWTADIPLTGPGVYNYYITTTDSLSRVATAPTGAPGFYYSFFASTDTAKPVIVHTAIGNTPKGSWPVTVSASVTDNIGVDSAWVRWYKNNTSTYKEFKLINTSGSTYAAAFNSLNSDVNVNDSIFYRIIAQDISANHNRDSSALYKFKIVTLGLCEDFSGGIVPPTGWTVSGTYWFYNAVSAYGTGTGSARFNFYNALSGVNESMITYNFDPSLNGDSLKFDIAHALYNTSIDSMIIMASTNGGTTYSILAPMYAGSNYTALLCMSTVTQTPIFTPTPSQWKPRAFLLPAGTNKINFFAKSAYGNDMFIDNICKVSAITGITPLGSGTIPTKYSLAQNYPNPFNPVTRINFSIPKQGLVSLKIYDVLGREVKQLVNEVKNPGIYSVDFNGTEFSSGVYFYKIESNGFTDVKKMLMIK
jgi:hypothetical protein